MGLGSLEAKTIDDQVDVLVEEGDQSGQSIVVGWGRRLEIGLGMVVAMSGQYGNERAVRGAVGGESPAGEAAR